MLSPVTDLMLCYVRRKGLYIDTAHVGGVAAFGKTLTPLNWGTPDRSGKKKEKKERKKERKKTKKTDLGKKDLRKKERKVSKKETPWNFYTSARANEAVSLSFYVSHCT